jgi:ribosomal protein S18 acetylase RimI-like enzyme
MEGEGMVITLKSLVAFFHEIDNTFPIPLSKKQDLYDFAVKILTKATICAHIENGRILAAVIGYTDHIIDNKAYISVVATVQEAQRKGLGAKLVKEFISICEAKDIDAVHLYTDARNAGAIKLYSKLGFELYEKKDDHRPHDIHFIYYFHA